MSYRRASERRVVTDGDKRWRTSRSAPFANQAAASSNGPPIGPPSPSPPPIAGARAPFEAALISARSALSLNFARQVFVEANARQQRRRRVKLAAHFLSVCAAAARSLSGGAADAAAATARSSPHTSPRSRRNQRDTRRFTSDAPMSAATIAPLRPSPSARLMPRVVDNQRETFRTDPLMTQLAQGTPIRYAGCLHAKESERRQTFVQNCAHRKLFIVSFLPLFWPHIVARQSRERESASGAHATLTEVVRGYRFFDQRDRSRARGRDRLATRWLVDDRPRSSSALISIRTLAPLIIGASHGERAKSCEALARTQSATMPRGKSARLDGARGARSIKRRQCAPIGGDGAREKAPNR